MDHERPQDAAVLDHDTYSRAFVQVSGGDGAQPQDMRMACLKTWEYPGRRGGRMSKGEHRDLIPADAGGCDVRACRAVSARPGAGHRAVRSRAAASPQPASTSPSCSPTCLTAPLTPAVCSTTRPTWTTSPTPTRPWTNGELSNRSSGSARSNHRRRRTVSRAAMEPDLGRAATDCWDGRIVMWANGYFSCTRRAMTSSPP